MKFKTEILGEPCIINVTEFSLDGIFEYEVLTVYDKPYLELEEQITIGIEHELFLLYMKHVKDYNDQYTIDEYELNK